MTSVPLSQSLRAAAQQGCAMAIAGELDALPDDTRQCIVALFRWLNLDAARQAEVMEAIAAERLPDLGERFRSVGDVVLEAVVGLGERR